MKARVLYESCATCKGSRLAPPDHLLHESLPDHSPRVVRPRRPRAGRVPCPACSGIGFFPSELTRDFVADLAAEHERAVELSRDFVELCEAGTHDGPSYLSDGALLSLSMRAQDILERDDKVPELVWRRLAEEG